MLTAEILLTVSALGLVITSVIYLVVALRIIAALREAGNNMFGAPCMSPRREHPPNTSILENATSTDPQETAIKARDFFGHLGEPES